MATLGSIIAVSSSGSGITNWDPIAQPNFIQSGVNKSGVYLIKKSLPNDLDFVPSGTVNQLIAYDIENNGWSMISADTNDKGIFTNETQLIERYPIAKNGNYAKVESTNTFWNWSDTEWVDTGSLNIPTSYTKDETNNLLALKVDKDGTKVLSDNNFTDEEKAQYDAYATNKEDADITILKQADVIDNLTSTDTNKPVSANKAKELKDQIDAIISPTQSNVLQKYVSVGSGNNSFNGQVDRKMQTIDFALTSMDGQSSCAVECEDGTYSETLVFGTSRSRRALRGSIGSQRTIINRLLTFNENCQQSEIHNFKFENTSGGYAIQVSSTLSNFVFDGLTCGGNHTNLIFLDVASGGSGYITINNCDLNNKIINLNNTSTVRYCYINNSVNLIINAGTGWIVIKNNCQNIFESSSNNNILEGNIANGVISSDSEYNAVVSLGASGNGYYLCNYTKSGVFSIGDVILRINPSTLVDHKHYNASSTYYVITTQKTYCKSGGSWKEIALKDSVERKNVVFTNQQLITHTHNLGVIPNISVRLTDGTQIMDAVDSVTTSSFQVSFDGLRSGTISY